MQRDQRCEKPSHSGRALVCSVCAMLLLETSAASSLLAQMDSLRPPLHYLDTVAVVAHRAPTVLRESAAATTVLTRDVIERIPARTLTDVLRYVPGLLFVERDGAGELPMAVVRGFFGGGETEYVILTVNGVPVNDLRTGLVEWSRIRPSDVERIEVLRGAASTLYGDAALGAVINVVTRDAGIPVGVVGEARAGTWEDAGVSVSVGSMLGDGLFSGNVTADRTAGFRAHSDASNVLVSAGYRRSRRHQTSVSAQIGIQRRIIDEAGPLATMQRIGDQRQSHPLYDDDRRKRTTFQGTVGVRHRINERQRFVADLRLRRLGQDQTRTILITPDLGDTQFHDEDDLTLWSRAQWEWSRSSWQVIGGLEFATGSYDSRYFDSAIRSSLLSESGGARHELGLYGEVRRRLGKRLQLYGGVRVDNVILSSDVTRTEENDNVFRRVSPRIGLNFAYLRGATFPGNAYASWTLSFKAPTLDQLYDVRVISTGIPGGDFTISNGALRPQTSRNVEVGAFQRISLGNPSAFLELAVSAYGLSVDDEIDFDINTFRYGNIQESRHEGLEAGINLRMTRHVGVRQALSLTRTVFRSGEHRDNRLKNIPAASVISAIDVDPTDNLEVTVSHRFVGQSYLDDANAEVLPGRHVVDASIAWMWRRYRFSVMAKNVTGVNASSLGFLLFNPSTGQQEPLVYPMGGRFIRVGVSLRS